MSRKIMKFFLALLTALFFAFPNAVSAKKNAAAVSLSKKMLTVCVGSQASLNIRDRRLGKEKRKKLKISVVSGKKNISVRKKKKKIIITGKKEGKSAVTVTAGKKKIKCKVTVKKRPKMVSMKTLRPEVPQLTPEQQAAADGIMTSVKRGADDFTYVFSSHEEGLLVMNAIVRQYFPALYGTDSNAERMFFLSGQILSILGQTGRELLAENEAVEKEAIFLTRGITKKTSERNAFEKIICRIADRYSYADDRLIRENGITYGTIVPLSSVISSRKALCEDYAILLERACAHVGISSWHISGEADGNGHAWSRVRIDGKTYDADPTWFDDGDAYDADWELKKKLPDHVTQKVKKYA